MVLETYKNDTSVSKVKSNIFPFDTEHREKITDSQREGSLLEHVISNEPQPHQTATQNDIHTAVLQALKTLPLNEARAVYERLGLGRLSSGGSLRTASIASSGMVDRRSKKKDKLEADEPIEMTGEALKTFYHKGVRRLRRRASDPRYPEVRLLSRLFNDIASFGSDETIRVAID